MHDIRPDERPRVGFYLGVLLLVLGAISGCISGTAGNFSLTGPDDPEVSDVQIRALTPVVSGRTIRWRITARITDRNDDVVGGEAYVSIHGVNENDIHVDFPEVGLTIVESDLRQGGVFSTILSVHNAPAGEISMLFGVRDASGNSGLTSTHGFTVRISGHSAPGSAARPEELRGGLTRG